MLSSHLSIVDVSFFFSFCLIQQKDSLKATYFQTRGSIDKLYKHIYSPEEILGYIYSILYSPTYRTKYHEFLKIDFPRIPLIENSKDFEILSSLGWELIQSHLMKKIPDFGLGAYTGQGTHIVEKIIYNSQEQKIYINPNQYFSNIPLEIWDFCIGGYQVLDKYLKSRKNRFLLMEEIENVENIANILAFTLQQMEKIDELYRQIDSV